MNGEGGSVGAERDTLRVRRLGVPFAPHGVGSSRLLEPPPLDGLSSEYRLRGDGDGGNVLTQPLGGLGGSYDSLASMVSLLSLPQPAAPASEPLHHTSSGTSLEGYNSYRQGYEQHQNTPSPVPLRTSSGVCGGVGGGGIDSGHHFGGTGSGNGGRVRLGSHLFAFHAESGVLFSGGYWDSTFRVTSLDTGRLVVSIARHRDVVTSLSLADGGAGCRRLVTASRDSVEGRRQRRFVVVFTPSHTLRARHSVHVCVRPGFARCDRKLRRGWDHCGSFPMGWKLRENDNSAAKASGCC